MGAIHGGRAGRSTRRLDLPLPASGTGLADHASLAHHTVTAVLAACGRAEDALEEHTLALIRVYAKTYNSALSLQ